MRLVDRLSLVTSPTLVVVGAIDPVTPLKASEEIVEALPEGMAQLEVISGAMHFTWLDAPDAYWPIVIEFVRCHTGRPKIV